VPHWLQQFPARNLPSQLQSPSESTLSPVSTAATNSPTRRQQPPQLGLAIPDISMGMHATGVVPVLAMPQAFKLPQDAPLGGFAFPGGMPGMPGIGLLPSAPSHLRRPPAPQALGLGGQCGQMSPPLGGQCGQMSPPRQPSPFAHRLPMHAQPLQQLPGQDWRHGMGRILQPNGHMPHVTSRGSSRAQSPQPQPQPLGTNASEPSLNAPFFPAPRVIHAEEIQGQSIAPSDRMRQRVKQATVLTRAPSAPVTAREVSPVGPRSLQPSLAGR